MKNTGNWLYEAFLPVLFYRVYKHAPFYAVDNFDTFVKSRVFIVKLDITWKCSNNLQTVDASRYSLCIGTGLAGDELSRWSIVSIGAHDSIILKDVCFHPKLYSKTWDEFKFNFQKEELQNCLCHIVDIDIPVSAVNDMKSIVLNRKDNESLVAAGIEVLKPRETIEEVLIERDLNLKYVGI